MNITTTAPTAAPTTIPQPARKVSFGGLKKTTPSAKTDYPVFPDTGSELSDGSKIQPGEAAKLADEIIELCDMEDRLKAAKKQLCEVGLPFYMQFCSGKTDIPSSVSMRGTKGEVLVTFANAYLKADENGLRALLGSQTETFFRQKFELKIDGDKVPEQCAQALIDELQGLFARHNAVDALSVTETMKPQPEFHVRRHLDFPVAMNILLNQACPIKASVKSKGRR